MEQYQKNGRPVQLSTSDAPLTHCGKCGCQVPLDSGRCPLCGAVIHEPTGRDCPECGTQMQDICSKCVVCEAAMKKPPSGAKVLLRASVRQGVNAGDAHLSIFGKLLIGLAIVVILGVVYLIKVFS